MVASGARTRGVEGVRIGRSGRRGSFGSRGVGLLCGGKDGLGRMVVVVVVTGAGVVDALGLLVFVLLLPLVFGVWVQ